MSELNAARYKIYADKINQEKREVNFNSNNTPEFKSNEETADHFTKKVDYKNTITRVTSIIDNKIITALENNSTDVEVNLKGASNWKDDITQILESR